MQKPLTKEQMVKIDRLYRKEGKSIKKIAQELHISDRRVSAYLQGKMKPEETKNDGKIGGCSCHKKPKTEQDAFIQTVKAEVKAYEESCYQFVETLYKTIMDEVNDLCEPKKISKKEAVKRLRKRLDNLLDAILGVTYSAGCTAIFTMPPKFKGIWIESILRDPKEALPKGKSPKGAKK